MRSLIFVSFLIVAVTISLILPSSAFGNTPGEKGYVPPSTDKPVKSDCQGVQPDQWWSPSRGLVILLNPTAGNSCLNR